MKYIIFIVFYTFLCKTIGVKAFESWPKLTNIDWTWWLKLKHWLNLMTQTQTLTELDDSNIDWTWWLKPKHWLNLMTQTQILNELDDSKSNIDWTWWLKLKHWLNLMTQTQILTQPKYTLLTNGWIVEMLFHYDEKKFSLGKILVEFYKSI